MNSHERRRGHLRWAALCLLLAAQSGGADPPAGDDPAVPDPEADSTFEQGIAHRQTTAHFRFVVHGEGLDAAQLARVTGRHEATVRRVGELLGRRAGKIEPIDAFVYARLLDKGLHSGDVRFAHADFAKRSIHVALEHGLDEHTVAPEALLLVRETLGLPRARVLEIGLGTYLSPSWGKRGWKYWAARIHAAQMTPSLAELLDDELVDPAPYALEHLARLRDKPREDWVFPPRESPLLVEPMAASLVDWLIEAWGREAFLERYSSWRPAPEGVDRLEAMWRASLDVLVREHRPVIEERRRAFPRPHGTSPGTGAGGTSPGPGANETSRGVNLTFEGFELHTGYLGQRSDSALARIRGHGANSVAVVPYAYLFQVDRPGPIAFLREAHKENDGSVIHAAMEAKRLGMTVLLKPQIQGGGWTGHLAMHSAEDWALFFGHYERWIRHYALLAEVFELEMLSLGVELVQVTTQNEERFRALAGRIRRLYSGQLTYAANWGSEVEQIRFWDALDLVGVDSYYPLSDSDEPSDDELLAGAAAVAQRLAALSRRVGKPIVLTEIGFPSHPAAWKEPWKDRHEVDLDAQARATEAMLRALDGQPWCAGTYWWKWSSDAREKRRDASHAIDGKPAEAVLARWYRRGADD